MDARSFRGAGTLNHLIIELTVDKEDDGSLLGDGKEELQLFTAWHYQKYPGASKDHTLGRDFGHDFEQKEFVTQCVS